MHTENDKILEELYRKLYQKMIIYANDAVSDRCLAEEVVQDTFRIACLKIDQLISSDNPEGWLVNTLKNNIRNIRRSRAKLNNLLVSLASVSEGELTDNDENMDFPLIYTELLGQKDFELLNMIVLNKYTMAEAADEFGISVEACKKRVQRAKKRLKMILEENS